MALRPICVTIIPFGTRPIIDYLGRGDMPDRVNFDRLWDAAIRPAIEALGYDAVRADSSLGALILFETLQLITLADLVLADVTVPDPSIYYQVGIRHAAQHMGCVLISADWARRAFDVEQLRQIRYPLPEPSASDETAVQITHILRAAIPIMRAQNSPFYEVFPSYPVHNPAHQMVFRKTMEELRLFQREIIEARSGTWDQRRARALDLLDRYYTGGHVQKAVALELLFTLRDCTDWTTTLQFIDSLPDDLRNLPQVKEQWALAQSKTGDHLLAIEALSQLIHLHGETSERRGLLGGRYRKLWVSTPPGPEKTRYLNKAINEYEQGMMLDLNDYYPSSNLPRLYRVRGRKGDEDKARTASGVTMLACTRARMTNSTKDEWLLPTLLGAAFDAGDVEAAREFAAEIQMEGPASWKLESTLSGLDLAIGFHDADRAHELGMILSKLKRLL